MNTNKTKTIAKLKPFLNGANTLELFIDSDTTSLANKILGVEGVVRFLQSQMAIVVYKDSVDLAKPEGTMRSFIKASNHDELRSGDSVDISSIIRDELEWSLAKNKDWGSILNTAEDAAQLHALDLVAKSALPIPTNLVKAYQAIVVSEDGDAVMQACDPNAKYGFDETSSKQTYFVEHLHWEKPKFLSKEIYARTLQKAILDKVSGCDLNSIKLEHFELLVNAGLVNAASAKSISGARLESLLQHDLGM